MVVPVMGPEDTKRWLTQFKTGSFNSVKQLADLSGSSEQSIDVRIPICEEVAEGLDDFLSQFQYKSMPNVCLGES